MVGVWRSGWSRWCWCERSRWFGGGGLGGVGVSVFHSFAIGVGNFFYNGDMRNLKTVMTGEAVDKSVDKLWITFLCLDVEYTITLINTRCLYKLLYEL